MILLNQDSKEPIYLQIYKQFAKSIEDGSLCEGSMLPSIRACAKELDVSNTTIVQAYQRLSEEGYVNPQHGSGYVVCNPNKTLHNPEEGFTKEYLEDLYHLRSLTNKNAEDPPLLFDFAYDMVDVDTFPFKPWSSICREIFFSNSKQACLYNSRQGLQNLRTQIAKYASDEFGVRCTSEQIIIMPTVGAILTEIIKLFDPDKTVIAMENPGYDEAYSRLIESGYTVRELPIYPYPPLDEFERHLLEVQLVFLTPVSQFPTNYSMPIEYRHALVKWAQRTGAFIIDDVYGWEIPSTISRVPSLAALDNSGRVITLGTFSNAFTPAVCLSYAILPPNLMIKWLEKCGTGHPQVPWQTQAAMSEFMRSDHWPIHIRKRKTSSQKKYEAVQMALKKYFNDYVEILSNPNSLFVLIQTLDGRSELDLINSALKARLRVYPTSQYWHGGPPANWRYVLVGFSGIGLKKIPEAVEALARAWAI